MMALVPKGANSAFLYQWSLTLDMNRFVQGGALPSVNAATLKEIEIPYPPDGEREKIIKILSAADEAIEAMAKLVAAKRSRKRALMQRLLTGRQRLPQFAGKPWETQSISDFTKPTSRKKSKPQKRFLALGIRSHGKGTFLKPDFDPSKIDMTELYEVREDDLIVNITFAWEGAVAIAGKNDTGALVSHRFPTFVFDRERAVPEYFRYLIVQRRFVEELGVISPGGAGRNRVLSKKDFVKMEILLPPVDEQREIAKILANCDSEITLLEQQQEALKRQKRGLMQQLLTGKRRVS
jgi:type I restriction enzyme S subunit